MGKIKPRYERQIEHLEQMLNILYNELKRLEDRDERSYIPAEIRMWKEPKIEEKV